MRLNTLRPAPGSRPDAERVGRGAGSGMGKTARRGHKGQKSRSGGFHKVGFEGGQMPLQRRVPKVGFNSRKGQYVAEVRLHEIGQVDGDEVNLDTLQAAGVVPRNARAAKVVLSGEVHRALTLRGVRATAGARAAIEKAGGKVEV
ncbi:50S ribosomal protein L15 [Spiribacter aquaticus]|uniref:Large ribosomal subunit protein uL15 n=1 Tax=Spiribacter aquaticus TaxID=1935996 RepID=A0A557RGS4_9GAMM|nr:MULTISPECIES: 50S ribosomal protein L15 [Spiribacter]KAF0280885.1 50S ribosomal protein L15 [Spiribacter roseus]TVO64358.1 50S ribosomal protein L15 [Spiribacter aquaticus]